MLERSLAEQRISALRATSGAGGVIAETGRERPSPPRVYQGSEEKDLAREARVVPVLSGLRGCRSKPLFS